jgi:hypothetical protein
MNIIKSSQAISCVEWSKETNVSGTISVLIIRDESSETPMKK